MAEDKQKIGTPCLLAVATKAHRKAWHNDKHFILVLVELFSILHHTGDQCFLT